MIDLLVIEPEDEGNRLDKLLAQKYPDFSRSYFQYLIENGLVLLNGQPVKKRIKPTASDQIEIRFALTPETKLEPEEIPFDILFEDEHLLVINKPAGLVVHPGAGNPNGTVANGLIHHCKSLEVDLDQPLRPGIVHRLDKDTTGVLLCAKTLQAQSHLVEQFATRTTNKLYVAIVSGHLEEQTIDAPIGRSSRDRKKMTVTPRGKPARTHVYPLAVDDTMSAALIGLETGRTHQIRVHMAHNHTPILGDSTYGNGGKRQLLHAWQLQIDHPLTGERLTFRAPLPSDVTKKLNELEPNWNWEKVLCDCSYNACLKRQ